MTDKSRETIGDEYSSTTLSLQECIDGLFENDANLDDLYDNLKANFIQLVDCHNDLVSGHRLLSGLFYGYLLLSVTAFIILFVAVI